MLCSSFLKPPFPNNGSCCFMMFHDVSCACLPTFFSFSRVLRFGSQTPMAQVKPFLAKMSEET